jgi:hypothetical protein
LKIKRSEILLLSTIISITTHLLCTYIEGDSFKDLHTNILDDLELFYFSQDNPIEINKENEDCILQILTASISKLEEPSKKYIIDKAHMFYTDCKLPVELKNVFDNCIEKIMNDSL